MFLVGDGHTNMYVSNTLENKIKDGTWKYIITNPPYGAGKIKAESSTVTSNRSEIAFLFRIINLLKVGGRACIVIPDGVLENPSFSELRKELMEKCTVECVISLPKFAFAPYTKEKTNAIYITKRDPSISTLQTQSVWMYIIDNDGLANSDKRFPTKLRGKNNEYLHDEISEYLSNGTWHKGKLEERWMVYDDSKSDGTKYIDEEGNEKQLRKSGHISMTKINKKTYFSLLPEYHLRQRKSNFVTLNELSEQISEIENDMKKLGDI